MATPVSDVLRDARTQLTDEAGVRWELGELLAWLNEAQKMIAVRDPDTVTSVFSFACTAGQVRQELGGTYFKLHHVVDVRAPAPRAVHRCEREAFERFRPTWFSDPAGVPENWFSDRYQDTAFYLYPAPVAGTTLGVAAAAYPAEVGAGDDIGLPDEYKAALVNYVCFRALSKDADYAGEQGTAAMYMQLFNAELVSPGSAKAATDAQEPPK